MDNAIVHLLFTLYNSVRLVFHLNYLLISSSLSEFSDFAGIFV